MTSTTTFSAAELAATRSLTERLQLLAKRLANGTASTRLDIIYSSNAAHLHDKLVQYGNVYDWYLSLDDNNATIFLSAY